MVYAARIQTVSLGLTTQVCFLRANKCPGISVIQVRSAHQGISRDLVKSYGQSNMQNSGDGQNPKPLHIRAANDSPEILSLTEGRGDLGCVG